jgi:fused signal recognition particle receptor
MSETRDAPRRGGFFSKVRRGLFMTHTEILEKLGEAVKKGLGFDESVLQSLEEALLEADVGAETAAALTEAVRRRAGSAQRGDLPELRAMVISEIEGVLAVAPRPAASAEVPLEVVFLVGVNGSGKTTTTAKLAAREVAQCHTVLLAAASDEGRADVHVFRALGRGEQGRDQAAARTCHLRFGRSLDFDRRADTHPGFLRRLD